MVIWIYKAAKSFPSEEKYALTLQLKRAVVSVVSNIAEGSSRKSPKDQAHFYQIAYSSLLEILNQLIIANDLQFITVEVLGEGRSKIESIAYKLALLRRAQLSKNT